MRATKLVAMVIAGWLVITGLAPAGLQRSTAATPAGTIAYMRGTEIRLIEPDGSNDRLIYTRPDPGVDTSYLFQDLVWRPDSAALAFVSDQENICSYWNQDIFTIRPDGSGLKRITNSPACAELASFPNKGTVIVPIYTTDPLVLGYVQGAPQAKSVDLTSGTATFENVADFGTGVPQAPVAIYGAYRLYGGLPADVQPGQTVSTGPIAVYFAGVGDYLAGANKPSWSNDGSMLGYVYTDCGIAYQIAANPAYGSLGNSIIEGSKSGVYPCVVDWGRSPSRANQFLYATPSGFDAEANEVGERIFLATEGAALPNIPLVSAEYGDHIFDVKWLPDGSGFLFAKKYVSFDLATIGTWTDIFRYDFGTDTITPLTTQLVYGVDGAIRKLSISPDGQSVVFELDADENARTGDLYLMNVDGSDQRLLVSDAASPTWSWGTPQMPPPAVVANFTGTPTTGASPLTVQFTDTSAGGATSWSWTFGDGGTSSLKNPRYAYTCAGPSSCRYDVSLTATGPGGSDTETKTAYITVSPSAPPAVMRIAPSATTAYVNQPVTVSVAISGVTNLGSFEFTLVYSPSLVTVSDIALATWPGSTGRTFMVAGKNIDNTSGQTSFGAFSLGSSPLGPDGSGLLAIVQLIPQAKGTASLQLASGQVADVEGNIIPISFGDGTLSAQITVYQKVTVDFTATPVSGATPLAVTFTDKSTGDYTSTKWDFGDGTTSTLPNPVHTYTAPGVYTVVLTASGPGGSDTKTRTAYISAISQFRVYLPLAFRNVTGGW